MASVARLARTGNREPRGVAGLHGETWAQMAAVKMPESLHQAQRPQIGCSMTAHGGEPGGGGVGGGQGDAEGTEYSRPYLQCVRNLPHISLLRATLCPKYPQSQVPTSVSVALVGGT